MDGLLVAIGVLACLAVIAVNILGGGQLGPLDWSLFSGSLLIAAAGLLSERLKRFSFGRHRNCILAGILLLALALGIYRLDATSMGYDEIVSISQPDSILDGKFIGPPSVYYAVMRVVLFFGNIEFVARFPSVVFGVLLVFTAYVLADMLFGWRVGVFAALFVATSPLNLLHMQSARMYTMLGLLSTASIVFFYRALASGRNRDWLLYGLFTVLDINVHFSAYLLLCAQAAFFALRRGKYMASQRKFVTMLLLAAVFTLLVPAVFEKARYATADAAARMSAAEYVYRIVASLSKGSDGPINWQVTALVFTLFVFGLYAMRSLGGDKRLYVAVMLIVPLALSPVMLRYPRYLFYLLPVYWTSIAYGMNAMGTRKMVVACILLLSLNVYGIMDYYSGRNTGWRSAAAFLRENAVQNAFVLPYHEGVCLEYYGIDKAMLSEFHGGTARGWFVVSDIGADMWEHEVVREDCTLKAGFSGVSVFQCR